MVYQCPMKCEGDKTYTKPGKCPVCGMTLEKAETAGHNTNIWCIYGEDNCNGQCVSESQSSFEELNLKNRINTDISVSRKGQYICPMRCEGDKTYPEPGDCPVCGMHLEQVFTFGAERNEKKDDDFIAHKKMGFRFIIALIFTLPVLFFSMSELVPELNQAMEKLIPMESNLFLQFALSLPVVLYASGFIFQKRN